MPKKLKLNKNNEILRFTTHAAAVACGMNQKTLQTKITRAGVKIKSDGLITLRDFYRAVTGDKEAEQTRLAKESADKLAMENAIERGENIPKAVVSEVVSKCNSVVRQTLLDMPANLASRCNPTDPAHALVALNTCRDEIFKILWLEWPKQESELTQEKGVNESE